MGRLARLASTALAVLLVAGCASRGQVRALEARLADSDAAARRRASEDAATRVALEGKLVSLQLELERLSAAADRTTELEARLAELERTARAPAPPPAPSRPVPDPAVVYAVPVAGAPATGSDDALVTIVRAGEYACPYCDKVRPTLDQLRALYGSKLRIVYRSYVVHPQLATIPARAACAAHKQRRFWDMDRELWEKAFATRTFDQPHLEQLAAEIGLDVARFRADLEGPCIGELQAEMAMLERFGVRATPSFFINGRYLAGAQPIDAFRALVDEELAKAEDRVKKAKKGKKQRYYDAWVLGSGLPALAPTTAPLAAP